MRSPWGVTAGALTWHKDLGYAEFQYTPEFIESGLEPSPIVMPVRERSYAFPDLASKASFLGVPGLIADSLTEKFGTQILERWLAKQGRHLGQISPVERLCYLGQRGTGALEYEPDLDPEANAVVDVGVSELVQVAEEILHRRDTQVETITNDDALYKLIQVGTSAGGAKAKAVIAWNEETNQVMSGQGKCPQGFSHWLMKFDEVEHEEHASSRHIGRIEYAYHVMAVMAGIAMTECRLFYERDRAHFMTRRFDRTPDGQKLHVQTYCALSHADRNPPGLTHYEGLFSTGRALGLGQDALDEMYLRMVFNIITRNQDDHSKNHSFVMDGLGHWQLSPAYDLCFSYKPGSRWIDKHQMCCNGKRDDFVRDDLDRAARAADITKPVSYFVDRVIEATEALPAIAADIGIPRATVEGIQALFRKL